MRRSLLVMALLAGCASIPADTDTAIPLDIFVFHTGQNEFLSDGNGVMFRIHNPTAEAWAYWVAAPTMAAGRLGPVDRDGWHADEADRADTLAPGESRLWLAEFDEFSSRFVQQIDVVVGDAVFTWTQTLMSPQQAPVRPGMHVLTYTVGVWINGTSFYTNVAVLDADPVFPRGYPAADFGGAALPVYVYDQDRSEQPDRSIDTCHFTTVPGYNALLKTQHESSTGVRFLQPEEAYTRPGNEDHFLYGEPLIFLNTVVAIEPRDERMDNVPDPQGACFDVDRYTPDPIPDVTRLG